MGLFIYSKLFELFDTLWLILKKRPVIHLHWCVRVLAQVTSPPAVLALALYGPSDWSGAFTGSITSQFCSTAGTRTQRGLPRGCGSPR